MGLKPKPGGEGWCKECVKSYNKRRRQTDCMGAGERVILREHFRGPAHIVHYSMGNYRITLCSRRVERRDR